MSGPQAQRFEHVVVGAGLAGLLTFEKIPSESKVILEATDLLGGRFSSGLHVMNKAAAQNSRYLRVIEDLGPLKVRWDREWVNPSDVDWKDSAWKGVYLSTWDHYFGADLCRVEFDETSLAELKESGAIRFGEPVVELGVGEGEGAWILKCPKAAITASRVHWCAGLTAFQNAVGKHTAQKFLTENVMPSDADKEFRGGFAIDWTLPNVAFEGKTELCADVAAGGLFAIPVKHGGIYYLMILHLEVQKSGLNVKTLTYVHEDILRDPKESLSLQKSLKRGLKMLFVDQNAVDMQTSSERLIVDQRILGASRGLTWLLNPQSEIGLEFAGEESVVVGGATGQGLHRATESVV
ncbi:MAG TPA: hypothetical protein VM901_05730 [Bdellovibrionota bacterium]|nr:hypothetical protein [Bdellovibrionota bacterium]